MVYRASLAVAVSAVLALTAGVRAEEKVLAVKPSPYNTIIVSEDSAGLRTLRFEKGGARQSVVKLGDPDHLELRYARVMPAGLAFAEQPQRVLIVGLGGGTIPGFLRKHFPRLEMDVVELDPEVVNVAKQYFGFREDESLRAYVDDGRKFIAGKKQRYDVIFLDAFGAENVPYALATREFLKLVQAALTPNGIVVGNIWGRSSNQLYDSMVRTYRDVFPSLYILDVPGVSNKILIAIPRVEPFTKEPLARRAQELGQQHQFGYDLGETIRYGFRNAAEEPLRGRVLLDKDGEGAP